MRTKKAKKMMDHLIYKIESLLYAIKEERDFLNKVEAEYERELEALKAKYYPEIEKRKNTLKNLEQELEKFAKANAGKLFQDGDIVETSIGRIIREIKVAVKRARGVLMKLEQLGWDEAIIIQKKVNWDVLETWPEEKLIACGTERVTKVKITYELYGEEDGNR
jgi:phage host-nuclease inhibitor protein Gam